MGNYAEIRKYVVVPCSKKSTPGVEYALSEPYKIWKKCEKESFKMGRTTYCLFSKEA
jgi:hypothetical protein